MTKTTPPPPQVLSHLKLHYNNLRNLQFMDNLVVVLLIARLEQGWKKKNLYFLSLYNKI